MKPRFLLHCVVAAFFAHEAGAAPCHPDFHGVPASQAKACFDHLTKTAGLAPVVVSFYEVAGQEFVAGSFRPTGSAYGFTPQLTRDQYAEEFKRKRELGFYPERMTNFKSQKPGVAERFTVVWKRADVPFENVPGSTVCIDEPCGSPGYSQKWFEKKDTDMGKNGYAIVDVAVAQEAGRFTFMGTWLKRSGLATEVRLGLTKNSLGQQHLNLSKKGYRLTRLVPYADQGPKYAAIWEKKPGTSVYELLITAAQYQQKYNQHTAQGYELTSVVAFGDRSTSDDFITAIWTKAS